MSILFSPLRVGSVGFRNRVVMPPMVIGHADADGCVNAKVLEHYGRRARAGVGTIIVEATYVDERGRCWAHGIGAASDRHITGLTELARTIHEGGAVAAIQLVHGGPQASAEVSGAPTVGPSAVPHEEGAAPPRELTVPEIQEIEERYEEGAERCVRAGFDAVEIHGAHGYLLDSFLSAQRNRRTDEYGGNITNRMRMMVETCRRAKARVGQKLVICRISMFNKAEGEVTLTEFETLVRGLRGVDILHLSTDGAFKPYFGGPKSLGQWTKGVASMPVIVAGGLGDPRDAERALVEGHCDLVAVGNAMIEDPEWAEHARHVIEPY